MDLSPTTALRLVFQVAPVTIKTAVLNLLRLSENAAKQSLRTEVLIAIIRTLVNIPNSIGRIQGLGNKDPGIKGGIWISKVTIPASSETVTVDAVLRAVRDLDERAEEVEYVPPTLSAADFEAEWTGPRRDVAKDAPRPDISEREQYEKLVEESPSDTTILYFHGGGYFCMDPSSHRLTTRALAKHTSGRVLSVRYRLAPQHPFPCALLDALHAYLYLIAPPPGAFHKAIKPEHIVFSGDSAGAGLATSLLLLLLHLQRTSSAHPHLIYNSTTISTKSILPAAIALNSPYLDITHSLPSIRQNAHYDYLFIPPSPTTTSSASNPTDPAPPETIFAPLPDAHWPTSPPRADLYAPIARLMTHPLVSPVMSLHHHWENSPPVWMCIGEEMLLDAAAVTARTISRAASKPAVQFLGWEGMPHCFAMLFPSSAQGRECMKRWGRFVVDVTQTQQQGEKGSVKTGAWWYKPKQDVAPERYEVAVDEVVTDCVSDEEMRRLIRASMERAVAREEEAVRRWEGDGGRARL